MRSAATRPVDQATRLAIPCCVARHLASFDCDGHVIECSVCGYVIPRAAYGRLLATWRENIFLRDTMRRWSESHDPRSRQQLARIAAVEDEYVLGKAQVPS